MALETPIQNWPGVPLHFFPESYGPNDFQGQDSLSVLNRLSDTNNYYEVPEVFHNPRTFNFANYYSNPRSNRYSKSFSFNSGEKAEGTFHWGTLDDSDERSSSYTKSDDGVVLLVGLFNLFAVVTYAGQKILTGSPPLSDARAIYWQVQKALDELVLRVHSSDAAANLISRALKSSAHEISGRELNENALAKSILQLINEKDHSTLNKIIVKLKEEISKAPSKLHGPKIDPKIYGPIRYLYRKITEPSRQGREFSSSLLQEVNEVTQIISNMSLNEIQKTLQAITELGQLRNRYDLIEVLKKIVPSQKVKTYGVETVYDFNPLYLRRSSRYKRASPQYKNNYPIHKNIFNTRHPRFSKAGFLYKARRMKAKNGIDEKDTTSNIASRKSPTTLLKRQGTADQNHQETTITTSWADGWFTLLTQASPVGLDIITLYSRAKSRPQCLRALMCKANGYWKKMGAFQAALSPFLSVLASWGMENESPHSLGDSLIAIRAGWMGKHCSALYPECGLDNAPHPLAEHALNFFSSVKKNRNDLDRSSQFSSKSGEIPDNEVGETNQLNQITVSIPVLSTTTTTSTTTASTSTPTTQTIPPTITTTPIMHSDNDLTEEEYPYDRYDSPYFTSDYEALPSGSVTGMALQDRPLKRMSVELEEPMDLDSLLVQSQPIPAPVSSKITLNPNPIQPVQGAAPSNIALRYPPYHDPKHLYIRNPIDNDMHLSRLGMDGGPSFLHQQDYSTYMVTQRPTAFHKHGHRSIPYRNILQESQIKSYTVPTTPKPKKHVKYKYGLRRGLPAHNVDGHSPLLETAAHIKSSKIGETSSHMNGPLALNPSSKEDPLDGKHISQFGPKDAITDPFRNELLYQFIRDRTI